MTADGHHETTAPNRRMASSGCCSRNTSFWCLSAAWFSASLPFTPGFASPENLGNICASMLPLLVVAMGQTLRLDHPGGSICPSLRPLRLASVVGAQVMTGDTGWLAGSPGPRRRDRRDARGRRRGGRVQRGSGHAPPDAAVHCHAHHDDVRQRLCHLAHAVEEHQRLPTAFIAHRQ